MRAWETIVFTELLLDIVRRLLPCIAAMRLVTDQHIYLELHLAVRSSCYSVFSEFCEFSIHWKRDCKDGENLTRWSHSQEI